MCRRPRLLAAAAATLLVVGLASPASADPITDKQRQAQQIADKIESLGEEAARLGEKYDGALVALQQAKDEVTQAQAKLDDLQARLGEVRSSVGVFAVRSYIYADQTDGLVAVMSGSSLTDGAAQREGYATVALGASSDVTDDMKALLEDTQAQQKVLTAKRDAQEKAAKDVANRQKAAEAAQAQQSDTLKKVKADLAVLVQQEQQRRAEAERRQAAAEAARAQAALAAARAPAPVIANVTPAASPTGAATPAAAASPAAAAPQEKPPKAAAPQVDVPATSPGAAIAVRAALSQLGVPYRFAAASPGSAFDCSGLTMWAWAQAGVGMAHFAATQYASFPKVPRDQLQPGDLVFFYSDIHHVGMYIGNGMFVQAPRTGDVVKISPLAGRNYIGAVRP